MRFFNTAGPVVPEDHYCIPPLARCNYGLGRRRTDLLILWPTHEGVKKIVIECKLLRASLDRTIREGLEQTRETMDRAAAPEGHLVVFDRTEGRTWEERIFQRADATGGAPVTICGM